MEEMYKNLRYALKGMLFFYRAMAMYEEFRWPSEGLHGLVSGISKLSRQLDNCENLCENQLRELLELISCIEKGYETDLQNLDTTNSISSPMNIDLIEKKRKIGSGGFGNVYIGINSENGAPCAIKKLHRIDDKSAENLDKEIKLHRKLQHQNIVKFYGSKIVEGQVSLYMEYVLHGSLKTYIEFIGALPERAVQKFTAQILSGLAYLHSENLVHRDIKPGNLLVDHQMNIKIADFGVAKCLAKSVNDHSRPGTIRYSAPEVMKKIGINSLGQACAADVWSVGCVVIEMFTGKHPFPDCKEWQQVFYKVCVHNQDPAIPEKLSEEGKKFLIKCFTRDPAKRPSAAELLSDPFVTCQNCQRRL